MKQKHSVAYATALALTSLGLTLAGCGGGGGDNASGSSSNFRIDSVSILAGSTWQINREIEVRFNRDVDFSTVNLNTVQVSQDGGAPAAGEFRVGTASDGSLDPRRIVFAPRCPTLSDYSDAGLLPGGLPYHINIVGGGGFTVRSAGGEGLTLGQTVNFSTPDSTQASVLFVDTVTGPPAPVIRTSTSTLDACYLELALSSDVNDRVYFQPRATFNAELGADVPAGFLAPLNLYSDVTQQISAVVVINQAIDPSDANVNASNVRLEYQEGTSWVPLAHTVTLIANCTQTGALVRVSPTGILPQQRTVRVVFSSGLRDVVGDGNLVDIVVGSFQVVSLGTGADEVNENFTTSLGADETSQATNPAAPRAEWGGGTLAPNFDFAGTGGPPDGQFDYEIGSSVVGSQPENPIIDTTFTLITDVTQSRTQAVVDGIVDVRNFTINQGSSLTVLGPNTLKIYASGTVRIDGSLIVRGTNNKGVATLNTTCTPETGADGNAGGGKGGTASYLTTQSTPKGEDGYGAFDQPGLGGGGGHTSYRLSSDEVRRPGGGGGGRLGADVMEVARPTCPDQSAVGLDGENGFPGTPNSNDAILGAGVKPVGGTKGPRPFGDDDSNNDFYGLKVMNTTGLVVQGELIEPWAGSGGHIILQSASQVDLSNCVQANGAGLFARGGQGGAGKNDLGGAHAPGTGPYLPNLDALPPNSYPTTTPATTECEVTNTTSTGTFTYAFTNTVGNGGNNDGDPANVVTGCGGDGGPGIIQIHVQRLSTTPANSDLKIPSNTTLNPLRVIISPTPIGATPANIQTLGSWDQMLPQFGRFSTGLSKWIPLGAAGVTPGSSTLHAVQFFFGGTSTTTGLVTSAGGTVTQLPPVLSGTLAAEPTLPYVAADLRTVVFDATGLDSVYTVNPNLMLRFGVSVTHGASTSQFEVVAASYSAGQMRLSVATTGAPLQPFTPGDAVSVTPRFFRVVTNGVNDALPGSATIQVRFQAAPADAAGNPTLTGATLFLNDAAAIQNDVNAANFKFVRFRVDFDILADGSSLTFSTPRPNIDFLRLPFRF
jgi:hypothetical protein